ncbi:MAG: hypothetical protein H0V79_11490 [Actinobacteria bacterium]|nr:hypothetical protein [Actinomycetota bacterium]
MITKGIDSASAGLFLNSAKGTAIPSAILRLNGGDGGSYELTNVYISETGTPAAKSR